MIFAPAESPVLPIRLTTGGGLTFSLGAVFHLPTPWKFHSSRYWLRYSNDSAFGCCLSFPLISQPDSSEVCAVCILLGSNILRRSPFELMVTFFLFHLSFKTSFLVTFYIGTEFYYPLIPVVSQYLISISHESKKFACLYSTLPEM